MLRVFDTHIHYEHEKCRKKKGGKELGSNVFIYTACMHCDSIECVWSILDSSSIFFVSLFFSANINDTILSILNQFLSTFHYKIEWLTAKMHTLEINLFCSICIQSEFINSISDDGFRLDPISLEFHLWNFFDAASCNIIHFTFIHFQNQIHNYIEYKALNPNQLNPEIHTKFTLNSFSGISGIGHPKLSFNWIFTLFFQGKAAIHWRFVWTFTAVIFFGFELAI